MKTVRTVVEGVVYFPIAILLAFGLGMCIMLDVWKELRDPDNSR